MKEDTQVIAEAGAQASMRNVPASIGAPTNELTTANVHLPSERAIPQMPEKKIAFGQEGGSVWFLRKYPQSYSTKNSLSFWRNDQTALSRLMESYGHPGSAVPPYQMTGVLNFIPVIAMAQELHHVHFVHFGIIKLGTPMVEIRRQRERQSVLKTWLGGYPPFELPTDTLKSANESLMSLSGANRAIFDEGFDRLSALIMHVDWRNGKPVNLPKQLIMEAAPDNENSFEEEGREDQPSIHLVSRAVSKTLAE